MFTQKIKISVKVDGVEPPIFKDGSDWIDLRSSVDVNTNDSHVIVPLGISVKLPAGTEAIIAPRSSSYKKFNISLTNGIGIIDNSYSGDLDEWKCSLRKEDSDRVILINKNDRIAQFRVQLSQKATFIQKLKWLFCKLEIVYVDHTGDVDRGGFGSTGTK
jgi:dUTP pyrophosphatase